MSEEFCFSKKNLILFTFLAVSFFIIFQSLLLNRNNYSSSSKAASPASNNYIINGNLAAPGEFPYSVIIFRKKAGEKIYSTVDPKDNKYYFDLSSRFICGGTLINPQWIATAAHCLYIGSVFETWIKPEYVGIIYNQTSKKIPASKGAKLSSLTNLYKEVNQVIPNKLYNYYYSKNSLDSLNGITYNDIALMKIKTPITSNISYPLLPYNDNLYAVGSQVTSIGYGCTNFSLTPTIDPTTKIASNFTENNSLYKLNWQIINKPQPTIPPSVFFVGDATPTPGVTKALLPGDSGSPTIIKYNGQNYFIGINSNSNLKNLNLPNSQQKVKDLVNWINMQIMPSPTPKK